MPPTSSVICPILVGRAAPLASARDVLDRANERQAGVLLVSGEAGIGKSRLLRAMGEEARRAGFVTLQGACFEADRALPYGPLLDLVRSLATTASPAAAANALGPALPELRGAFPELALLFPDVQPRASHDPEQDRRVLFHALGVAFQQLARTQPLLVMLEDVHWSDDASLDLLLHLARVSAAERVAFVVTYRSDEIGPGLARALASLDRLRLATELPLRRLGAAEVASMLRAIFGGEERAGDDFVAELHAWTEGNPFFVEETLKALTMAGDLVAVDGGGWRARPIERMQLPRTAVEAVRRRLAGLSVPARELASVAAVAGRRFDFDLLRALTPHDERALLALVKELVTAQLVAEESADRFAFRHALTREAICAELLGRERVGLHRAVAAALAARPDADANVDALAYHAFEGEDWRQATERGREAAERALALFAPRAALAHLDRALAAAERSGEAVNLSLHLARGRASETLGDFDAAHDAFTTALERARASGEREVEWEALHALGLLWAARDYEQAGAYRRSALDVARTLGDPARTARSLNRVGNWHLNLDEPQACLPFHEEALGIFERLGDRKGIAETVDLLAMSDFIAGEMAASAAHYERSLALFTELEDRRGLANALGVILICGPALYTACTASWESNLVPELLETERPLRLARDIGWRAGESFIAYLTADTLAWRGEVGRALVLARESLTIAEDIEHRQWQAGALRVLGTLHQELGAVEEGRQMLERAHAIACRLGSRTWIRWTAAALAAAMVNTGDPAGAEALLDSLPHERDPGSPYLTLGERQMWTARAEAALALGRPDEALAIADARLAAHEARSAHAATMHAPPATGRGFGLVRLPGVRARALEALERFDEAEAVLLRAAEEAQAQGAELARWRVEAMLGGVQLRARRRGDARRSFDRARSAAHAVGERIPDATLAATYRALVDAAAPPPATPSPRQAAKAEFGGLTRRERQVAALVAHGKSNRLVARTLGIGERTVEDHVANSLGKLGFTSRAQLAAWAVESGLTESGVERRG